MAVQLNKPEEIITLGVDEIVIQQYEPFEGQNIQRMPELLARGRVPIPASEVMKRRVAVGEQLPDWGNSWFDTSDLVAYDAKGRSNNVKFILTVDNKGNLTEVGKRALSWINPDMPLVNYAIDLSQGNLYDTLRGEGVIEVSREKLGEVEGRLKRGEVIDSKPWRILARHPDEVPVGFAEDKSLLPEYVDWVASKTGQGENMGVYFDANGDKAKMRAWFVYRLGGRSGALGRYYLVYGNGRFVGLAPEAQIALAKGIRERTLDARVKSDLDEGRGFEYNGRVYVPTSAENVEVK
ncbi:MAG: hypothetical protein KJ718_00965 [Nanoarchaeota archaeon]|nr:hypothetical protein [Nanoarchaeota archaeon]MBU1051107.1 hypothetical protein [Nanoarchaeota archaeon]MBU1987963.1 hypothetical protein [Nanoarchaeota archaeon]